VRPGLVGLGYRVRCLTLAGHDAAERRTAYRLQDLRDDVLKELDELGLSEVTLVGHSLGAFVATQVAMEGRVERLVLEELPVPPMDRLAGRPARGQR
jgi:pimeloyl-ACP methyl ester carboxylesterase